MKIYAITAQYLNKMRHVDNNNTSAFKGLSKISKPIELLERIGFTTQNAEFITDDIFKAYSKPERGYHGIKHIKSMLESFDKFILENNSDLIIKNADEFRFAILMHDYINGEAKDVEKSAKKAKEFLHKISHNYDTAYVEKLILATDYSKKQNLDFAQQLMQDIDIEILGKSATEYKEYSKAIRLQYNNYPDKIYKQARTEILQTFLDKDKIYNTQYYRDKYEQQARKNIKDEIASLMN